MLVAYERTLTTQSRELRLSAAGCQREVHTGDPAGLGRLDGVEVAVRVDVDQPEIASARQTEKRAEQDAAIAAEDQGESVGGSRARATART
jgi:hypothetical protein